MTRDNPEAEIIETRQPWPTQQLELDMKGRATYSPTPLSPYELMTVDDTGTRMSYFERSIRKFDALIDAKRAHEPEWLVAAVHTALMSLHADRCDRNYRAYQDHLRATEGWRLNDVAIDLMHKAKVGTATVYDLLRLHGMELKLPSIGLAKQSHPFDWDTKAMDNAVDDAISHYDKDAKWLGNDKHRRYAFYRTVPEDTIEARGLVIVRKRNVALLRASLTGARVLKRSSFVLRLDTELPENLQPLAQIFKPGDTPVVPGPSYMDGLIQNALEDGREDIAMTLMRRSSQLSSMKGFMPGYVDAVSQQLAALSTEIEDGIHDHAPWLTPIATSYYVRDGRAVLPMDARVEDISPKRYFEGALGNAALRSSTKLR